MTHVLWVLIVSLSPNLIHSQISLVYKKINDKHLYLNSVETSNCLFQYFLKNNLDLKESYTQRINFNQYDEKFDDFWSHYYFTLEGVTKKQNLCHPKNLFNFYPTVFVTHKEVVMFCEFNTNNINKNLNIDAVVVRLPTQKEWVKFAEDEQNIFYGSHRIIPSDSAMSMIISNKNLKKHQRSIINCATEDSINNHPQVAHFVLYKKSRPKYFINQSGNVCEMVDEEGICMGGSWHHDCSYCLRDSQLLTYEKPEGWLGFRFLIEADRKLKKSEVKRIERFINKTCLEKTN